jgi:uncharacterized membrane protein
MNDVIEVSESQQSLKTIGHISYFMHAVVAIGAVLPGGHASVLLLLIAFFIDMFKRDEARGTWQESHFSWRIRTVLWAGALYLVTAPLWLLFFVPGWIAWSIISLWFLYRIARGWLNLSSNTPMPMPA